MVCPVCENKVEYNEDPDNALRGYCHRCNIMIAIYENMNDNSEDEDNL